jgi:excisionase family DNA binding protein
MTSPGPLLDADGAAELLNVPRSWVLAQARDDAIPHVRLGHYVRFNADDLREWVEERRRGPGVTPRSRRGSPQTRHECREGQR